MLFFARMLFDIVFSSSFTPSFIHPFIYLFPFRLHERKYYTSIQTYYTLHTKFTLNDNSEISRGKRNLNIHCTICVIFNSQFIHSVCVYVCRDKILIQFSCILTIVLYTVVCYTQILRSLCRSNDRTFNILRLRNRIVYKFGVRVS